MTVLVGQIKAATFSSDRKDVHGYIVEVGDGKHLPLVIKEGGVIGYPKSLDMFSGHLCKIFGERCDLMFSITLIESLDDPELTWSL
jgi:hypothetical protein